MRLPGIDYTAPVQSTTQLAGAPYEAASGLSKVISDGLAAYHQELIKTQQQEAAVKVSEGLNQAELAIKSRKYVSAQQLRDTLGEQMPAHVQERLQSEDPVTGQKIDNEQIPMWAVADALYAHAAKRVTESAAQGIDGIGWQTDFKGRIAQHVVDRRQSMAQQQLAALDTYLQTTQLQQVDRLVNAGDFGGAQAALKGSTALPPEVRQRTSAMVETARQEAPARAAEVSTDPAFIKAQLERLKTDKAAIAAIPDERRTRFIQTLEARVLTFEGAATAIKLERQHAGQKERTDAALAIGDAGLQAATLKALEARQDARDGAQRRVDQEGTGRLFVQLERTGGYYDFRGDPVYRELSPTGQAAVEARANGERRQRAAASREDRAAQLAADREALGTFALLDLAEKASQDVDQVYAGASKAVRLRIQGMQKKAAKIVERGAPVGYEEFHARVKQAGASLGNDKERLATFVSTMDGWYFAQKDAHPDAEPAARDIAHEVANQLAVRRVPGIIFDSDRPTFLLDSEDRAAPLAPPEKQTYPPAKALAQPPGAGSAPAAAAGPAETGSVLVDYKGRRLRIPRARLAEAIEGGATEVE